MLNLRKLSWLLTVVILSAILFSCNSSKLGDIPKAKDGVLDLRGYDFEKGRAIHLNGDWKFYWNQFITEQAKSDYTLIEVPGLWNGTIIDNTKIKGIGYASYALKVLVDSQQEYAIRYENSATSCEIFVDGVSLHKAGIPSTSIEKAKPSYKPALLTFTPQSQEIDIVMHISNFHHKKGGQWEPLTLGPVNKITRITNQTHFFEILFMGGILIMALFHILVFGIHYTEKSSLYFGLFALLLSFRFVVSGEFLIYQLADVNWTWLVRIDYFCFYTSIFFFLMYIRNLYPNEVRKSLCKIFSVVIFAFSTSVIIHQPILFSRGMIFFHYFLVVISTYGIYVLIDAYRNKRDGAMYFLIGFLFLFLFMVHDILNENEIIHSITLSNSGIAIFILFQALILASRIRKSLVINQRLSEELSIQNNEFTYLNKKYRQQNKKLKKAKEKAEESDRFKSAFLANISHEIRTPMNGILGFMELLSNPQLSDQKREQFQDVVKERGNHLLGIVNDIIDISKIETGQIVIRNEEINVDEFIENILNTFFNLAERKGLQLYKTTPLNSHKKYINIDKLKLKQILENLISNSLKFTSEGSIEVGYKENGNWLEFYVKDTGIGLSDKEQKVIFDRFNQANNNISQKYGGTGLGLAIVKAFVEKMAGEVWVESKKGEGAMFCFKLPHQPVQKKINNKQDHQTDFNRSKNLANILLVEDIEINAILIQEMLSSSNYEIIHAKDGAEALKYFNEFKNIDLVLMDIKLPDTDGYRLTKDMKSIRNNIPIIAQTAFALQNDKEYAIQAGCDDHIAKPIDQTELLEKINRHINKTK